MRTGCTVDVSVELVVFAWFGSLGLDHSVDAAGSDRVVGVVVYGHGVALAKPHLAGKCIGQRVPILRDARRTLFRCE